MKRKHLFNFNIVKKKTYRRKCTTRHARLPDPGLSEVFMQGLVDVAT